MSVPKDYVANTITGVGALQDAGYTMEKTDTLRNMPIVPDKSQARTRLKGENAGLQRAWYGGQVAKFFLFDEAPLAAAGGQVPLSPIYVTFNINPGAPSGGPASGFRTESRQRADSQRSVHAAGRYRLLAAVARRDLR